MSGSGTGVRAAPPITPYGTDLGRVLEPMPHAKMPLMEWAKRLGLNPIHFLGGKAPALFPNHVTCSQIWPHLPWQSDGNYMTHYDLALTIQAAEQQIEEWLKFNVAPDFLVETYAYPRYLERRRTNMLDGAGRQASIQLRRGKLLALGVRKLTFQELVSIVYYDRDFDGLAETAYVTLPYSGEAKDLAVYPPGVGTHPSWEIRYPKGHFRSGNSITLIFDFWYLFKPELFYKMPGKAGSQDYAQPFDALDPSNLLSHVEVYEKGIDTDSAYLTADWEGVPNEFSGSCYTNGPHTAAGGAFIRDDNAGLVSPYVGSEHNCYGSPDRVRIAYYSGAESREYLSGYTLDPMPALLAEAVFYLSVARLGKEVCGCSNVGVVAKELREDMALVSPQGNFLAVADEIQVAPFGTRRGEWLAYQTVKRLEKYYTVSIL